MTVLVTVHGVYLIKLDKIEKLGSLDSHVMVITRLP